MKIVRIDHPRQTPLRLDGPVRCRRPAKRDSIRSWSASTPMKASPAGASRCALRLAREPARRSNTRLPRAASPRPDADRAADGTTCFAACTTAAAAPMVFGLSGLDIALWDIAASARQAALPAARRSARSALPAYASLLRYGDAAVGRALCRAGARARLSHHQAGTRITKMSSAPPDWRARRTCARRRLLVSVDGGRSHCGVAPARRARPRLARGAGVSPGRPCGTGAAARRERDTDRRGRKRLQRVRIQAPFEAGARYAQPSVTKLGGVSELRKVFALGESFGVPVVPHSPYFGPGPVCLGPCGAPPRRAKSGSNATTAISPSIRSAARSIRSTGHRRSAGPASRRSRSEDGRETARALAGHCMRPDPRTGQTICYRFALDCTSNSSAIAKGTG